VKAGLSSDGKARVKASRGLAVLFLLLTGIGVARIVSTYHVFSGTWDEVAHVATGMEWLQNGTYTLEPMHPPLARVAVALGPFLSGIRWDPRLGMWQGGNAILAARNQYGHNLALARMGVLPFFMVGAFLAWRWTLARYGAIAAGAAALSFTTFPPILGHAALATTDMAAAAGFTAALLSFIYWLEKPTAARSAAFGAAAALGTLCKFSVPIFLLASGAGLWLWRRILERREGCTAAPLLLAGRGKIGIAALAAMAALWSGYRFSLGSAAESAQRPYGAIDRLVGTRGWAHEAAYALVEAKCIPARPLIKGLAQVREKEERGEKSFLLGQVRSRGWWYFFPVALAVKTPIAGLILAAMGAAAALRLSWAGKNWILGAPPVAAAATLSIAMLQNLSIGVRHVLPMYSLLAIMTGVGFQTLWRRAGGGRAMARTAAAALLAWQTIASARAHPDYLAYFNELAGRHPEKILITSDLDWGQDLLRLSSVLRERKIPFVSIAYSGAAELEHLQLPPFRALNPYERATGWVAVGMMRRFTGGIGLPDDGFQWLSAYEPVELVGKSILLYYIPD